MKQDNQWHDAIIYQIDGGDFQLVDDLQSVYTDPRPKVMVNGQLKYNKVKCNWNHGQPIVDCGDFKMSIVDTHAAR